MHRYAHDDTFNRHAPVLPGKVVGRGRSTRDNRLFP